jgi:hypothetical protein
MTSTGNRFGITKTMISIGILASLGVTACSGAGDDGSTDTQGGESVFKKVELEALLSTEKIRQGVALNYSNGWPNGTVWVRNAGSTNNGCTAQVMNRWFLLTSGSCVLQHRISGTTNVHVRFTQNPTSTTNPNTTTKYNGPAEFNASGGLGLIFLRNGMTTCQGTRSVCSSTQVNTPENAVIQFFIESFPKPTNPFYAVAGYGPSSQSGTDFGHARGGPMPLVSSRWSNGTPFPVFEIILGWANDSTRPCPRDDGGPAIPFVQDRVLHAATAMQASGSCEQTSGTSRYLALTEAAVLTWVNNTIGGLRQTHSLPFGCASGIDQTTGLAAIHCDNDGRLYPR